MRLSLTLKHLTKLACWVALVMAAFSLDTGVRHLALSEHQEEDDEDGAAAGWRIQAIKELVSTAVVISLSLTLLCIVTVAPKCSPRVCSVLSGLTAAAACFTLSNVLTSGLMLLCFASWMHYHAFGTQEISYPNDAYPRQQEHQAQEEHARYRRRYEEPFLLDKAMKRPVVTKDPPTRMARLLAWMHSFLGVFGLTLIASVVVFVVRFQELDNAAVPMPLAAQVSKSSARAILACLPAYLLPSVERMLPRLVRWIPRSMRIKDRALARRALFLGGSLAVVHVLAQFALFVELCNSDLYLLAKVNSVLAWVSGFLLVWASLVVFVTSRSPELTRMHYYLQRVGQVTVLVCFAAHVPELWVAAMAAFVIVDLLMRWRQISPALVRQAEVLFDGGLTHLHIIAPLVWGAANSGGDGGEMVNLQILQVGTAFKPFTIFRLPGEEKHEFHCLIKTHSGGWTDDLEATLANNTKLVTAGTRVYLDGPHRTLSHAGNTRAYSNLLLLASGVGITVPLSVLGTLDADKVGMLHLEWSLRASDLPTFASVFGFLYSWKVSTGGGGGLRQLSLTVNVSGVRPGGEEGEREQADANLRWLRALAASPQFSVVTTGSTTVPFINIRVGRIPFDQVLAGTAQRVTSAVGVFGCASRDYCVEASRALANHNDHAPSTSSSAVVFHNKLEVV